MIEERGSGRTRKMVMELPREGDAVVVVHNEAMRHYVRRMIHDLRGAERESRIRVVRIDNSYDARRLLLGLRCTVAVDHAFVERSGRGSRELITEVLETVRRINSSVQKVEG